MPQLASGFVQQKLLSRVDLVQLMGKYSTLKPSGSLFKCCCPFHQEKTPSCMIYPSTQHFKCFGCGAYGDALDFIIRLKHLTFIEAVTELAHYAGVEIEYEQPQDSREQWQQQQWQQQQQHKQAYYDLMERVCDYFTAQLYANPLALNYLQQRGIDAETIKAARLGYAPQDFGYLHTLFSAPNDLQLCRELGLEVVKYRTEPSFSNLIGSNIAGGNDAVSTIASSLASGNFALGIPSSGSFVSSSSASGCLVSNNPASGCSALSSSALGSNIAAGRPAAFAADFAAAPNAANAANAAIAANATATTTATAVAIQDAAITTAAASAAGNSTTSAGYGISSGSSLRASFASKNKASSYAFFRDRIMIPLRDRQGHVIAFGARCLADAAAIDPSTGQRVAEHERPKYINSRESDLFKKHQELFGLYECLKSAPQQISQIIVVEGYMDVLSLRQAGVTNVVAALGTAFSSEHFKLLQRYTPEIVLCFDGDEAGRKATWRALQVITPELWARCVIRVAYLPPEHDPDSFVRTYGPQAFAGCIQKSLSYSESIVLHEGERYGVKDPNQRIKLLASVLSIIRAIPDALVQEVTLQMLSSYLRMDCKRLYTLLDLCEPQLEFCPVPLSS